jgi:hypothetical protein
MTKMKYVLLAFAILLAVAGAFALAAGYATALDGTMGSLIAGTVALSAGVLILGQVFILRALEALQVSLNRQSHGLPAAYPRAEASFDPDTFAPQIHPEPAANVAASTFDEAATPLEAPEFDLTPIHAPPAAPPLIDLASQPLRRDPEVAIAEPPPLLRASGLRGKPARAEAPLAPRIDTNLLLQEALAEPPVTQAAPPDISLAPKRNSFPIAPPPASVRPSPPLASPSLSEMWRRVTVKADDPPPMQETVAEDLLPPPSMPGRAAPAIPVSQEFSQEPAAVDNFDAIEHHPSEPEQAPDHPQIGPAPPPPAPSPIEAEFDWFDRALAGIEEPAPAAHVVARPPETSPKTPDRTFAQTFDKPALKTSPETPPAEKPSFSANIDDPETSAATTQPAVQAAEPSAAEIRPVDSRVAEPRAAEPVEVGRYEADGTMYVMFSDGSIEAQSEQGVYRFSSMAELKAFFDEQAVPQ